MSQQELPGLTNGFLPLEAFSHLAPTAVGVVDLERGFVPVHPAGGDWAEGEQDGLVLVRLHGEPLKVVFVPEAPASFGEERLARLIWESAKDEVEAHRRRLGCLRASIGQGAGVPVDDLRGSDCPALAPVSPGGTAAVILCTAGRGEQLRECLPFLLAQEAVDYELVVVDNRPADGLTRRIVEEIAAGDGRVLYVAEDRPGLSFARNRGLEETQADLVAFTDDDVVVDPRWLAWMLSPFAEARVAATSGLVLPLELQSESQKRFEQYAGFARGFQRRRYGKHGARGAERLLYPFMGDVFGGGASMAFRRSQLLEVGAFDPALGAGSPAQGGEDIYAFTSLVLGGAETVYEPRALCWHRHRADEKGLEGQVEGWGVGLGAVVAKLMVTQPWFYAAIVRSLPLAWQMRKQRRDAGNGHGESVAPPHRPDDLLRIQRGGIVRGPFRYAQSVRRARRLHGG